MRRSGRSMNRKDRDRGLCPLFGEGERGPHVTHCRLGRGLPSYRVRLDPSSRLATTDMGRKLGVVPLWGELGPHITQCCRGGGLYLRSKFHLDPSIRLATIHQRHRQTDRTEQTDRQTGQDKTGQRSNSIGRDRSD